MSVLLAFVYVIAPAVAMFDEPKERAHICSQAYFSEEVHIVEDQGEWVKIRTDVDGYTGWIKKEALCERSTPFSPELKAKVKRLSAHLYDREDTEWGPLLTLPFESQLRVIEPLDVDSKSRWLKVALPDDREMFIQRGDVELNPGVISLGEMCELSKQFLGLPYTWGGRSSSGYDCSGFMQMLYRQMGIFIPRDAKDQMKSPLFVETTEDQLKAGDLIFFGYDEARIRHVGMYLGDDQFIHAGVAENTPYIRIRPLSIPEWNGSGKFKYRAFRTLR